MKKLLLILAILLSNWFNQKLSACHIMGADLTYQIIDSNIGKYRFTLTCYRSCACIPYGAERIYIRKQGFSADFAMTQGPKDIEVTPICLPPDVPVKPQTNCPGMTPILPNGIKGVNKWIYTYEYVLGKNIGFAYVAWKSCCRNTEITTIDNPSIQQIWVQAVINTNYVNSSPIFTTNPVPYWCRLKFNTYSHGAIDTFDERYIIVNNKKVIRDSFAYQLYTPFVDEAANPNIAVNLGNPKVTFNPIPELHENNPIHTKEGVITLNKQTGSLSCTPTKIEDGILAIVVKEYRAIPNPDGITYSRVLVGYVCRDMQLTIRDICDPIITSGVITDSLKGANYVTSEKVDVCGSQKTSISFQIIGAFGQYLLSKVWRTPNSKSVKNFKYTQRIVRRSNVDTLFGTITFDSTIGVGQDIFELEAYYCSTIGIKVSKFYTLEINYRKAVTTDHLRYYCTGGKPIHIEAKGDSLYSWSPQKNITAASKNDSSWIELAPDSSRTYIVRGKMLDPTTSCTIVDSVRVIVIPRFNYTLSPKNSNICLHDSIQVLLNTQISDTPYRYTWIDPTMGTLFHPQTNKRGNTISSPKIISTDNATYQVEIENKFGCILRDSIRVNVKGVRPNASGLSARSIVCPGDTTLVSVKVIPKTTGPSMYSCSNANQTVTVTSGTPQSYPTACNPASPGSCYPNPFSTVGTGQSSSTRIIYRKDELVAAGLKPGIIKSIAFNISNAINKNFENFEVRIGSTTEKNAVTLNVPMFTIFGPALRTVSGGWSGAKFSIPRGFDWDGNSNIVIETHASNSFPLLTSNQMLTMNTIANNEVAYKVSDTIGLSAENTTKPYTGAGATASKPQIQIEYCSIDSSNPSLLNTTWSPASKIFNLSNPRAIATISPQDSLFIATVGTPSCYDTATVKIKIDTNFKVNILSGKRVYCMTGNTQPTIQISCQVKGSSNTTIQWSCIEIPTFTATTSTISTPLGIGTYHFIVHASDIPCSATDTATITVSNSIPLGLKIDSPLCTSNTGKLKAVLPSGTTSSDFIFRWAGLPYETSGSIQNLSIGSYTLTILSISDTTCQGIATAVLSTKTITLNVTTHTSGINCFGGTADSLWATASHTLGSGSYSYAWIPADTGRKIINKPAGSYTVTVTDNITGCFGTASHIQREPIKLSIDSFQTKHNKCYGDHTGEVNVFASGGTLGNSYIFQWNNQNTLNNPYIQNLSQLSSLYADNLVVTVTDINGCTASAGIQISEPSKIKIDFLKTENASFNGTDGKIIGYISGGTALYTYHWEDMMGNTIKPDFKTSSQSDSILNLSKGIYFLTVTDENGCQAIAYDTVKEINCGLTIFIATDSIRCNGDSDGKIHFGAIDSLHYQTTNWYRYTLYSGNNTSNPPINMIQKSNHFPIDTAHFINIPSNNYAIRIQTDKGCDTIVHDIDIFQNPRFSSSDSTVMPSCYKMNDGQVYIHTSGFFSPYTYNFGSGFQSNFYDLSQASGFHTMQIKNGLGCIQTQGYTIPTPDTLGVTIVPDTPYVNCKGMLLTDSARIVVTSNNPALLPTCSYINKPGANTDTSWASMIGMPSGNYSFTTNYSNLSNGKRCPVNVTFTVKDPDTLVITPKFTDPSCSYTNDGMITGKLRLNETGNKPVSPATYTYELYKGSTFIKDVSTALDTVTFTDLDSGLYSLRVTDVKSCKDSKLVTLTKPDSFIIGVTAVDASCLNSKNGSVEVTSFTGGNPTTAGQYRMSWTMTDLLSSVTSNLPQYQNINPATGLRGLASYTVEALDSKGCKATRTVTVDTVYELHYIAKTDSARCYNAADGKITITNVYPSSAPSLNYNIGGINLGAVNSTTLGAGTYNIIISDGNGCSTTGAATIEQPSDILILGKTYDAKCHGEASGSIKITISGGTPVYKTPNWDNGSQYTDSATDLKAGQHQVTVIDGYKCVKTATFTILEPSPFIARIDKYKDISCFGADDGEISVKLEGGTPTYSYVWNNNLSGTTSSQTNLKPGSYRVTVTDLSGCTATTDQKIQEPKKLEFDKIKVDSVTCPNYVDGAIDISVMGGTISDQKMYEYSIDGGATYLSGSKFSPLAAGDYNVIVRDNNNCVVARKVEVGSPEELYITAKKDNTKDTLTMGEQTQLYYTSATKSGVIPSISNIVWRPSMALSCSDCAKPMASPYSTTLYTVEVRYHKNCLATSKVNVPVYDPLDFFVPSAFTPGNGDGLNDQLYVYGNGIKTVLFQVYNRWGEKVFESDHLTKGWDGTYKGESQTSGVYSYIAEVQYLNGEKRSKKGSITLIR